MCIHGKNTIYVHPFLPAHATKPSFFFILRSGRPPRLQVRPLRAHQRRAPLPVSESSGEPRLHEGGPEGAGAAVGGAKTPAFIGGALPPTGVLKSKEVTRSPGSVSGSFIIAVRTGSAAAPSLIAQKRIEMVRASVPLRSKSRPPSGGDRPSSPLCIICRAPVSIKAASLLLQQDFLKGRRALGGRTSPFEITPFISERDNDDKKNNRLHLNGSKGTIEAPLLNICLYFFSWTAPLSPEEGGGPLSPVF